MKEFILWGCSHRGHEHADLEGAEAYLNYAKETGAGIISLGDLFEGSIPGHKPQTMWAQKETPQQQLDEVCEMFEPVKKQIVLACTSNHSARTERATSFEPDKVLFKMLGIPNVYVGHTGFRVIRVGKVDYRVAINHGKGAGVNEWKDAETALRVYPNADIVALSHRHYCAVRPVGNAPGGKPRTVLYARTGSLMGWAKYAREAMYAPQPKGFTILRLDEKEKFADASVNNFPGIMRKYGPKRKG